MSSTSNPVDHLTPLQNATLALKKMRLKLDALERARTEPVAIIGLACRFPGGANSPDEYWRLIRDGIDAIKEVPPERWDNKAHYDPNPDTAGKTYTSHGGFLDDVDKFDPQLFNISPREAAGMDPQQRLFLEVAWEALEHAAQAVDQLGGSRTGVFVGISGNEYLQMLLRKVNDIGQIDPYAGTGNLQSAIAGRLSYLLGLNGPAMVVDTACSSSLVAVHLACQSLRAGNCSMALAAGVNMMLSAEPSIFLSRARALSADGRCKTFDAAADGYVRGEGCGVVVLKRLSDAEAAGDRILAVVRGSSVNHDGASSGFTVPNGLAQEAVIRQALSDAGTEPVRVSYVEAHGTGTSLGDPIEVRAIAAVLCNERPASQPLVIGSVKTNIGHLEAAAGIASLIKVVLSLNHKLIPPHLHFKKLNPYIQLDAVPIRIPVEAMPWAADGQKLTACVGSFGLSGTNSYAVIEEPPAAKAVAASPRQHYLLPLSAKSDQALQQLAARYDAHLETHPPESLADVCFTAGVGRSHFSRRVAITAQSREEMHISLKAVASGSSAPGVFRQASPSKLPAVAFLFSGQGSQYPGMGRRLYETQPVFRDALNRCDELLRDCLPHPLLAAIDPAPGAPPLLDHTAYTQPALFALGYALSELWRSWGIQPAAVMGHSVGEYVAACVAGVFSLEDGLRLIATRGRLMQSLPQDGAMAAVFAGQSRVAAAMAPEADRVSIAAANGPVNTVISGEREAVHRVVSRLEAQEIHCQPLRVSHAFHSPLVEPILEEFYEEARSIAYVEPRIPVISNLTGQAVGRDTVNAEYWRRHIRDTVRFSDGVRSLSQLGCQSFLELGPHPTLLTLAQACLPGSTIAWLPSLRRGRDDEAQMTESLATLYVQGASVNWKGVERHQGGRAIALPTYPFHRERYWIDVPESSNGGGRALPSSSDVNEPAAHPVLGRRLRLPLSREVRFETRFSSDSPSYLNDHRLYGMAVVPAASHIAMVLAGMEEAFGPGPCTLQDVIFVQPLALVDSEFRTLQLILSLENDSEASFQLVSLEPSDPGAESWIVHCSGKAHTGPIAEASSPSAPADIQTRCQEQSSGRAFYSVYKTLGYDLGPTFQWIGPIWRRAGEALCGIEAPDLVPNTGLRLHPGIIDSCFQLLACSFGGDAATVGQIDRIAIPFSIATFKFHGPSAVQGTTLWCHAVLHEREGAVEGSALGNLRLFDDNGAVIAEVEGLYGRQASRQALAESRRSSLDRWMYEVRWQPDARANDERARSQRPGSWLIFADRGGAGAELANALEQQGGRCALIHQGASFEKREPSSYVANPTSPEDFVRLLKDLRQAGSMPAAGVVHLWSLDATPAKAATTDSLEEDAALACGSALHLFQALASTGSAAPLWLVTRGAHPVPSDQGIQDVASASLVGLGRVMALENQGAGGRRIDLDPAASVEDHVRALTEEIFATDVEPEVAYRDGLRYVPRLVRSAAARGKGTERNPVRLEIAARGVLDRLTLKPMKRSLPGPGQVEIRILASGMNFRDVLNALGMYPGNAGQLGGECTGRVVAVGEGVTDLRVDDHVIALAPGSFSTFVTVPEQFVIHMPYNLSFVEAATIPITFLTAYYGLHHLATMTQGDRVLIHAAAGGVGLAAVQLARLAGAEVFATAGRPEKREFLKSLGVQHVMDSRTLAFADEVMEVTEGRGVDIVLNSLAGDFVQKSLSVLAPGGRFLELGKRDLLQDSQVAVIAPGVSYAAFDLAEVSFNSPALIRSMFEELLPKFVDRTLVPLPHEAFPLDDAVVAFRHMAQAKHIGKVVLTQKDRVPESSPALRSDATYLITGGLGALGLRVARWMVEQGARYLVLIGRSESSPQTRDALLELRKAGAQVREQRADVSQPADLARVLTEIDQAMPPLRGIVHAAGVLDDGVLLQQDARRLQAVMAPKVAGAWNLHSLTDGRELDFFVLFSSSASVFGSPGQGNYAAANAFLDALAHYRRALDLPGLSINWGPWGESGMAAAVAHRNERRWAAQGLGTIAPDQGLQALEQLLRQDAPQVMIVPIHWPQLLRQFADSGVPPLLSEFAGNATTHATGAGQSAQSGQLLKALTEALPRERREVLITFIQEQIARVLGLGASQSLDLQQPLSELGLDSLMAVELRNALGAALGRTLPPTVFFDFPTLESLTQYLIRDVLSLELAAPAQGDAREPGGEKDVEVDSLLAQVDQLPDADVASLLRRGAGA